MGTILTAAALTAELTVPSALTVNARNRLFITDIRLEAGENAVELLEADGYEVMLVGLNAGAEPEAQVYMGYKLNEGAPITNVLLSADVGDSLTDANGVLYECASHVDVDAGVGGGAGCIYFTRDESVGTPLVGLNILRSDADEGTQLYPITNDGAEIVRTPDGVPGDLERSSQTVTGYLAQIRDGIVKPYISEIGVVTDTDKWNAIYTACERGYNYYMEGDIDSSPETYTIIAYKRTADVSEAVTNITAIAADTVEQMEAAQLIDSPTEPTSEAENTEAENAEAENAEAENTEAENAEAENTEAENTEAEISETEAAPVSEEPDETQTEPTEPEERLTAVAVGISGIEYVRVSSQPITSEKPYYLYQTKDIQAGNPVSMLYGETLEEDAEFLFSTWVSSYFASQSPSGAATYCVNEDLYSELENDLTVMTKVPVQLLDDFGSDTEETTEETTGEDASEAESSTETAADSTEEIADSTQEPENTSDTAEPADTTEAPAETSAEPAAAPETDAPAADPADTPAPEESPAADENLSAEVNCSLFAPLTAHAEEDMADDSGTDQKTVGIVMLTARDGLPESAVRIGGIREETVQTPIVERTERSSRTNKFPASVFGERGVLALVMGCIAVVGAGIAAAVIRKKHPADKQKEKKRRKSR